MSQTHRTRSSPRVAQKAADSEATGVPTAERTHPEANAAQRGAQASGSPKAKKKKSKAKKKLLNPRDFRLEASGFIGKHLRVRYQRERAALEKQSKSPPSDLVRPVDRRPPPLKLRDLELVKTLGQGGSSGVYLVRTTRDTHPNDKPGTLFAVKVIPKRDFRVFERTSDHFKRKDIERRTLYQLDWNPFVAGFIQALDDPLNIYLALEFIPCGTLADIIALHAPTWGKVALFYFANIICALEYLYEKGIVHGDVKPANLLVGGDGYLCLTDFGIAGSAQEGYHDLDMTNMGTGYYRPPEFEGNEWWAISGLPNPKYPDGSDEEKVNRRCAADRWSAGAILYEMVTAEVPYKTPMEKFENVVVWPRDYPPLRRTTSCKEMVELLLSLNPDDRPSFEDITSHIWFLNMDWDGVRNRQYAPPSFVPPSRETLGGMWHRQPLPEQRTVPGLKVVDPGLLLRHDNRFPRNDEGPRRP